MARTPIHRSAGRGGPSVSVFALTELEKPLVKAPIIEFHRSVRREQGTDPRVPFEGARFNLSATITPEEAGATPR